MDFLTANAPAKINWYLNIVRKREDGYHELESIMQTIALSDTLEFRKRTDRSILLTVSSDGGSIRTVPADASNLVCKAAEALGVYGVEIHLTKRIPAQAGLGGGSSDAACALMSLNRLFQLGLTRQQLAEKAVTLGADVPFFLYGGACIARGIGEVLEPIAPVTRFDIRIRKPETNLSTPEIFRLWDRQPPEEHPTLAQFLAEFSDNGHPERVLYNGLESVSVALCPQIAEAKAALLAEGAAAAMMTGSGSAVFGLFEKG